MGRRLNVSTPTVINTELVPLDESFYIDVDGQMEQWYYDNTEQYAPNRKVTPLLLVPVISAFDKDTSTSYTPAFNTTQWFANEWNEAQGKYIETEITNQVDSGSADYVIQGNNLLVKKNVSYSRAVSIRCVATYIDPRDSGVTYAVESSVNLTTNRTADVVFPEVDIISPSGRAYNPLVDDENSQYDFKGVTTNNPVQPLNTDVRRYGVDVDGTEEILNSGEAVAPIMDIRYGNNPTMANQEFMYRQTAGGTLVGESIDKAYIERIKGNTVAWNLLVRNGNFADGTNYWTSTSNNVTISAGNNIISIKGASTSAAEYYSQQDLQVSDISGHKFYFSIEQNTPQVLTGTDERLLFIGGVAAYLAASHTNVFERLSTIVTAGSDSVNIARLYTQQGITVQYRNAILVDLTLIYGAGNEPTTPEQFEADYEKWFGKPLSYEEYDEGSLRPVLMQSIKTTGFNQWDEDNRVNGFYISNTTGEEIGNSDFSHTGYVPVLPNTTYYLTGVTNGQWGAYYDANKNFVSGYTFIPQQSFTTPANAAYVRIAMLATDVSSNICINISDPSKNGTYEPYEEKVQGLDVTAIKGRLDGAGESVTIFPDGLKSAGSVHDEIFVEDGLVKAIKRVGSVDLGTLTFSKYNNFAYFTDVIGEVNFSNSLSSKYQIYHVGDSGLPSITTMFFQGIENIFRLQNTSEMTLSEITEAMQGVMLYYELATPETYVLDPITDFVWYGIKNGQEVLADTLPWYVSGQGTDNLVVDAMYGENINVVLRCKMMDGETLSPSKAYATLNWRIPDIETLVQSDNGGAVRSSTNNMTFDTIVNVNGDVLSDTLKQKHLAFNWKIRKNNVSTETDKGWGQRITIDASDLYNAKGSGSTLASTLVGNEVYLKGAYEEVTDDGEIVTDNGEVVYDRPIDE